MRTTESPAIFSDPIYRQCLELAQSSKSAQERYGSLLIKDGYLLGSGYNRAIVHPSFPKLYRPIYQGYANHAEVEALNDGIMAGYDVDGAEIYVGGYFPKKDGLLFLHDEFTCRRCPPVLESYGITTINVPTPDGWVARTIHEAHAEAESYTGGTYNNRVESIIGLWTISNLI